MTESTTCPRMPFRRKQILDISPTLRNLAAEGPVSKVQTPAGDDAWLVTGYQEVKALLADDRLGWSHKDPKNAPKISGAAMFGDAADNYATEKDDHARMRRLLNQSFSPRRIQKLRSRMQADVDRLLDDMLAMTPPVDLHQELSFPLPTLIICELLGVPLADRELIGSLSTDIGNLFDSSRSSAALADFSAYVLDLIRAKRAAPGADIISDLIAADGQDSLGEKEIVRHCVDLLFAGLETTVTRIDFGVVLLLSHPEQHEAFQRDPALVDDAVEEILRVAVASDLGGLPRYAHADIEVAGVRIRAGDAVMLSVSAANRDGLAFDRPDRFDIQRRNNRHLAFGGGQHYCLGAALARDQLGIVLGSLFRRVPNLQLAVPVDQLELRGDHLIGGLTSLPVTW